jgi:hypothetical protein
MTMKGLMCCKDKVFWFTLHSDATAYWYYGHCVRLLIFSLQTKHSSYISEALEGPYVTLVDSFMCQDCLFLCGTWEAGSSLFRRLIVTVLFSKSDCPSQDERLMTLYAS